MSYVKLDGEPDALLRIIDLLRGVVLENKDAIKIETIWLSCASIHGELLETVLA